MSHFLNHAQNNVWVSAGGITRFANRVDWMKKVKKSKFSVRINDKTSKVSQNIIIGNCSHQQIVLTRRLKPKHCSVHDRESGLYVQNSACARTAICELIFLARR